MKRRLVVFGILFLVLSLSVFPARAASGDHFTVTSLGGGSCGATAIGVPVHVDQSFSAPTSWQNAFSLNGSVFSAGSGIFPAGSSAFDAVAGGSLLSTATFPYTWQLVISITGLAPVTITAYCSSNGAVPIVTIGNGGGAFWNPGDDRLNRDPGQPAALYCRNGGDVQVWKVDALTSRGTLILIITKAEIAKVKDSHPAANTLIKASKDGKFKLYYLPGSDELSFITTYLNSDKPYAFVFKACS